MHQPLNTGGATPNPAPAPTRTTKADWTAGTALLGRVRAEFAVSSVAGTGAASRGARLRAQSNRVIERKCCLLSRKYQPLVPQGRNGRTDSLLFLLALRPAPTISAAYSARSRRYALLISAFMLTPVIRCDDFESSARRDGFAAETVREG